MAKISGAINQAILCLQSEESNSFIYHYLTFLKGFIISTYIQGGQGNLSGDIIKSIKLQFPTYEEQVKIANLMDSSDELIAEQVERLVSLKNHKNGLTQQLFPIVSEVYI